MTRKTTLETLPTTDRDGIIHTLEVEVNGLPDEPMMALPDEVFLAYDGGRIAIIRVPGPGLDDWDWEVETEENTVTHRSFEDAFAAALGLLRVRVEGDNERSGGEESAADSHAQRIAQQLRMADDA